ncbi:MAG TPA: 1,4-dihydroxy-2-naphthoate polyprenyltransferase [Cyclobacteriaceae bacterium]|jgi:1,4-dihydroxy-2-naphthoate octaprenyltransferase
MSSTALKSWISALRLRTLPLALASIGMGSFLAAYAGRFNLPIFSFSALTTIFLQILSNLANDYGDSAHGADHSLRKGPNRMVQSGLISKSAMRFAILVLIVLSLVSGIYLLYLAFGWNGGAFLVFLLIGITAILAAIAYTAGSKPYGYSGLGDLSVLIFFGLVGVLGTYYLYTGELYPSLILPALSCGFFSISVLNLNNIRDIESDKMAGKKSIPVRLGRERAVIYHEVLLIAGTACALAFVIIEVKEWTAFIFVITTPLFVQNFLAVKNIQDPTKLDPYLRQMAISTLIFVLVFGIGLLFSI